MTGVRAVSRVGLLVLALGLLTACAVPGRAPGVVRYDLGLAVAEPVAATASLPSLALNVQASAGLDGAAMHYRLSYADARQLHAYALARWRQAPAELVQQRLHAALSRHYALRQPGSGAGRELKVSLEEFSQVFVAPDQSQGVLRLRISVLQASQLVAQRDVVIERPAPSPDAAGGVQALAAATDAAVIELLPWLLAQ